jgi:crotonobetainyl-CoA:carnitine CoA-transferase CaiB-like acyl-CoA transferase
MARSVDAQPWVAFTRYAADAWPGSGGGARPLPPGTDGPLGGVRVLDLTRVIAGPTASRLLGLLGADVLRIDPPAPAEAIDQYLDTGAGKRSAVADLADPAALHRVHALLDEADILLTGYRPGALAAFGLDGPTLAEHHPHLAHAGLSAWGTSGPWGDGRGFDSIVQSCTGIGAIYGGPDAAGRWRPGALPVQALDIATGYGLAAAAMGLFVTRTEGGGGTARLSLARTAHALLDAGPPEGTVTGLDVPLAESDCPHGRLRHVAGPVLQDDRELPLAPPGEYGAADLGWRG